MTKLAWGTVGQRFYEAGVDRGVLFIDSAGVPWNGLKSVNENPSGGDPKPFYIDGVKYLNIAEAEEFEATIEALAAPDEFSACDGTRAVYAGLFATQQPRKSFSMCYRTLVGNDIEALDLGYKIHIVYNALAQPSTRNRSTINNSSDPLSLSWAISTTPPDITGFKPTAHLIIDSRTTPTYTLSAVEDILYGSEDHEPRLPTPAELLDLFSVEFIVVDNGDGSFTATGPDSTISMLDATTFQIDSVGATFIDADSYTLSS